jgi:LysM repeat protein
MFRHVFYVVVCFCTSISLYGQRQGIKVEGKAPDVYLKHKVAPNESFSVIGRLYGTGTKDILTANNTSADSILRVNQVLKIPLTPKNLLQGTETYAYREFIKIYHFASDKDNFDNISSLYNGVSVDLLKKWNAKVNTVTIPAKTKIVIGYIKDRRYLDSIKKSNAAALKKEVFVSNDMIGMTQIKDSAISVTIPVPAINFDGGVFKSDYLTQTNFDTAFQSINALCTSLNSSSGWKDGKYYALIGNVAPGTILKISYANKSVYCKVLGPISDTVKFPGVNIIISAASASELGLVERNARIDIFYPKNIPPLKF